MSAVYPVPLPPSSSYLSLQGNFATNARNALSKAYQGLVDGRNTKNPWKLAEALHLYEQSIVQPNLNSARQKALEDLLKAQQSFNSATVIEDDVKEADPDEFEDIITPRIYQALSEAYAQDKQGTFYLAQQIHLFHSKNPQSQLEAARNITQMYCLGTHLLPKDHSLAEAWYERAIEIAEETQQNTAAGELLYALAILKGVEDLNLTVDYLDRAVAHKNVPAMTLLGHIYRGGKFDPENGFAKAFGWFYTAQQKGDKSAQQPLDQQIDELSADPALLQKTVDWFSQPVELLENPYFPVQEIQDRLALIQLANGESFSD